MSRIRDERGQVLPLVLVVVVVGLLLAVAAAGYALQANRSGDTDQRTRNAQQAADAGTQQQLYAQNSSQSVNYDLNGGPLGLGADLECAVPNVTSTGISLGTLQVEVGAGRGCPGGDTNCQIVNGVLSGCGSTLVPWQALDNHDYYESEFFPNGMVQHSGGTTCSANTSYCDAVEFPTLVSIGCDTRESGSPDSSSPTSTTPCQGGACTDASSTSCPGTGNSNDAYSRELALLAPVAPLSSVEGENDVTVDSAGGSGFGLDVIDGDINAGWDVALPSVSASLNLSASLQSLLSSLLSAQPSLSQLQATIEYGNAACATKVPSSSSGCDGDSPATCSPSTCAGTTSGTAPVVSTANYVPTGKTVCQHGQPSSACDIERGSFTLSSTTGVASVGTSVSTGVSYTPGMYGLLGATACPGVNQGAAAGCSTVTYSGGDLTITPASTCGALQSCSPGSLSFTKSGTYVFCNFDDENAAISGPTSGSVQIYVLSPTASQCASSGGAQGNFIATSGVANTITSLLDGGSATSVVDPSGFQIYVAGDPNQTLTKGAGDAGSGTTPSVNVGATWTPAGGCSVTGNGGDSYSSCAGYKTLTTGYTGSSEATCASIVGKCSVPAGTADDPDTQVYIGNSSTVDNLVESTLGSLLNALGLGSLLGSTIQNLTGTLLSADDSLVVYAPRSQVEVAPTLLYEGSAVGWNVDLSATALVQDLDLDTYPLSPVVNGLQVVQTIQCDNSREVLDPNDSTNFPNAETDDTKGC